MVGLPMLPTSSTDCSEEDRSNGSAIEALNKSKDIRGSLVLTGTNSSRKIYTHRSFQTYNSILSQLTVDNFDDVSTTEEDE